MSDVHELLESEVILRDDYPVCVNYLYIVDRTFRLCPTTGTVGQWKRQYGIKEIRRADLFGHPLAKLGDGVMEAGGKG